MANIYLLKKIRIKTNPDNTTDNILKYKAIINWNASNIIILATALRPTFPSVLPYLDIISSTFSLSNLNIFLIKKQGLWQSNEGISVKTYAIASTSCLVAFWCNHYLLLTIIIDIGFWILKMAIKQNRNNYYNILSVPYI